jgi:hypothetical protein
MRKQTWGLKDITEEEREMKHYSECHEKQSEFTRLLNAGWALKDISGFLEVDYYTIRRWQEKLLLQENVCEESDLKKCRTEPFAAAEYAELQKRETLAMLSPVICKEGENNMTKREEKWGEFVKLTEEGKTCKETAEALGVSIQSVSLWRAELKKHRASEKPEEVIKAEPDTATTDMAKDVAAKTGNVINTARKIGNIPDNSVKQEKKPEKSEQSEKGTLARFNRPYLQRIDQLIDTMAPICAGDDNTLQETAKLAYKILLHGLSDEFPVNELSEEEG